MRGFPIIPLVVFNVSIGSATEIDDLRERVQELERRQQEAFEEFHASKAFVRPYLKDGILLGGYFETGFTHLNGPNTSAQYSSSAHILGINLSADFTPQDRFVMQLQSGVGYTLANPHNDPAATPSQREYSSVAVITLLTQGFFEHRFTPLFNVQTGLGYTPFGVAFQQRESVLFKRRSGPEFLRASGQGNVGIAFPLWTGVHVHGSAPLNGNQIGYNAYTFSPTTQPSSVGAGSRLWYRYEEFLTLGLSHQIGETDNSTYQSYGADLDMKIEECGVTLEYGRSSVSHGKKGPEAYYATPYYQLVKDTVILYATAEYVDNPNRVTVSLPDPYKVWSIGGGVNWLPFSNVRIRFGYLNHNYVGADSVKNGQDRDVNSLDLSIGVAF
ncbi:MAG: hypothetical protein AB7G93_20320 [Bdellovibrionales bacterium]